MKLSLYHQSIWKFKKSVMMADFHLYFREWVSIPSFLLGLLTVPPLVWGKDSWRQAGDKQGEAGQGQGKRPKNQQAQTKNIVYQTPSLPIQSAECLFHVVLYCVLRFSHLLRECHVLQTSLGLDVFALSPQKCRCCGDASQIPHLYSVPQVMSYHRMPQHVLFFL